MSGAPCSATHRARVAEALGDVLGDHSARALGRTLGHEGHTITNRGTDLARWPALDLVLLAADHDGLRQALIGCLMGADAPKVGEAITVVREAMEALQRDGAIVAETAAALADGRVSDAEGRRLEDAIMARRRAEDDKLLPAIRACRGGRS